MLKILSCFLVTGGLIVGAQSAQGQTISIAPSTADTICSGTAVTFTATPSGVATPHYQWLKNSVNVGTDANTYATSGLLNGDVVMCELLNSPGGSILALSGPRVMTVDNMPAVAPISGSSTVCLLATTTLGEITPGGTWNSSHPLIAPVSSTGVVTGTNIGTDTISYTLTNSCGTGSAMHVITVMTTPLLTTITGPATICRGATATYSDTTGGIWSVSTPSVATISAGGDVTTLTTGVDTISYTATNGCGTSRRRKVITIIVAPVVTPIAGARAFCQNDTVHLSDTYPGGTWRTSDPLIANFPPGGGGGGAILRGITGGTVTITYRAVNACGADSTTVNVTVNPLPFAYPIYGSRDSVCQGVIINLIELTTGGNWTSQNAAFATVDALGNVMGIGAGIDTIFYTVSNDCGTNIQSFPVYVYCPQNVKVPQVNASQNINIYPNPTSDLIIVDGVAPSLIEIANIYGQKVRTVKGNNKVSLAELPAGVYFVSIFDETGKIVARQSIVKQ